MHSKNKNYYSHCPLKKRPVFIVKEGIYDLTVFNENLLCVRVRGEILKL